MFLNTFLLAFLAVEVLALANVLEPRTKGPLYRVGRPSDVHKRQTGTSMAIPPPDPVVCDPYASPDATCAEACGAGSIWCSETIQLCYNPTIGDSCCDPGKSDAWGCLNTTFCLINKSCCPNGEDPRTCARNLPTPTTLPDNWVIPTGRPYSSKKLSPGAAAGTTIVACVVGLGVLASVVFLTLKYCLAAKGGSILPTAAVLPPPVPPPPGQPPHGPLKTVNHPQNQQPQNQQPQNQQPQNQQPQNQQPQNQQPQDKPDLHRPKIKISEVVKHHHHLDPLLACRAENCEYNSRDHRCDLEKREECPCTCRDEDCPVTKKRKRQRVKNSAIRTAFANIPFVSSVAMFFSKSG